MAGRDRSITLRERMAYEAARIMVEQRLNDFDRARRKAAERTGIFNRRHWPSNEAVQQAILTQRRLFLGPAHVRDRQDLHDMALQAMRTFEAFSPRLVGAALTGAGDRQTGIELFLFAERSEDVLFALLDQQIPWEQSERVLRYPDGQRCPHPAFRFMAGEIPFQLIVLPLRALRNPPLDPVTDRPQRGADLLEVERLRAEADSAYRFEIGT